MPWTWNFHDYIIPTSKDIPDIKSIVLQSGSGKGPFGAKGIGEPSISAAGPAAAGAIADAIGKRITHLPVTAERVFFALHGGERSGTISTDGMPAARCPGRGGSWSTPGWACGRTWAAGS